MYDKNIKARRCKIMVYYFKTHAICEVVNNYLKVDCKLKTVRECSEQFMCNSQKPKPTQ